jgi:hypothetical protein
MRRLAFQHFRDRAAAALPDHHNNPALAILVPGKNDGPCDLLGVDRSETPAAEAAEIGK